MQMTNAIDTKKTPHFRRTDFQSEVYGMEEESMHFNEIPSTLETVSRNADMTNTLGFPFLERNPSANDATSQ